MVIKYKPAPPSYSKSTSKDHYQERESVRKIRTGITEKEHQFKCCGSYYREGVKGRGSEIIQK